MSRYEDDDGPVYYREILKTGFLARIPEDHEKSKLLLPLGHKKVCPKPLYTTLCVHNGRTPFLEQYVSASSASAHCPSWRAKLPAGTHTAVRCSQRHQFTVVGNGVRVIMEHEGWEAIQEWVSVLRSKLQELNVCTRTENVYCVSAVPAVGTSTVGPVGTRLAARDPASPLPPVPAQPPHWVPGIELNIPTPRQPPTEPSTSEPEPSPLPTTEPQNIDISDWDSSTTINPTPSTSQDKKTGVAKICGQNIALDDSLFKRLSNSADSDGESLNDGCSDTTEASAVTSESVKCGESFKQTVVVSDGAEKKESEGKSCRETPGTNVTVIEVSNRRPPHTAIPVLGPDTDIFNFEFTQNVTINPPAENNSKFVNIVNTENNSTSENGYGTVFQNESEYGHISLTTTVNLTGVNATADTEGVYERLSMASTSHKKSPLPIKKLKSLDVQRKASLPNLEVRAQNTESNYEYLFPNYSTAAPNTVSTSSTVENGSNGRNTNIIQINSERIEIGVNSPNLRGNSRPNDNVCNVPINSADTVPLVPSVERANQNSFSPRLRDKFVRKPNSSQKPNEVDNVQSKPIWKRGLTELSLLTRLRSKKNEDHEQERDKSNHPVNHRSRPVARYDAGRRRSSSWSNDVSSAGPARRMWCDSVTVYTPPVMARWRGELWVAQWQTASRNCRVGDRIVAVDGKRPAEIRNGGRVEILYHQIPLGKIFVLNKERLDENIGIKLDSDCSIVAIAANSPASRVQLPSNGWAVTEVNNRPINLVKGGQADLNRLSAYGKEITILIQPADLIKKIRAVLKSNKHIVNR